VSRVDCTVADGAASGKVENQRRVLAKQLKVEQQGARQMLHLHALDAQLRVVEQRVVHRHRLLAEDRQTGAQLDAAQRAPLVRHSLDRHERRRRRGVAQLDPLRNKARPRGLCRSPLRSARRCRRARRLRLGREVESKARKDTTVDGAHSDQGQRLKRAKVRLPSVGEKKQRSGHFNVEEMEDPLSVEAIAKFRVRKRDIQGLERLGEQASADSGEAPSHRIPSHTHAVGASHDATATHRRPQQEEQRGGELGRRRARGQSESTMRGAKMRLL
jgi:hypothetical protein